MRQETFHNSPFSSSSVETDFQPIANLPETTYPSLLCSYMWSPDQVLTNICEQSQVCNFQVYLLKEGMCFPYNCFQMVDMVGNSLESHRKWCFLSKGKQQDRRNQGPFQHRATTSALNLLT